MKDSTKGTLAVAIAAVMWGFSGVCIKKFYAVGISLITILSFTAFFTLILLLVFNRKKIDFRPKKKDRKWLFGVFFFGNATAFTFFSSYKYTTVTNAVFLHYAMPLFAFLIAIFFLKEKITKWKFLALFLAVVGISLVFNIKMVSNGFDLDNRGNLLALISAVMYAMAVISARKLKGLSQETLLFWNMFLSSIFMVFLLPFSFTLGSVPLIILLLIYIFIFTYISLLFFYYGATRIEASRTSIITLLEVVFAVITAYFFLGEVLTVPKAFGGLFILISSSILIIKQNH